MKPLGLLGCLFLCLTLGACATLGGKPSAGSTEALTDADRAAMAQVGSKLDGLIVWSSSRMGNHDLFTMMADGSDIKRITASERVDWFPRFSNDGSRILFIRSKKGWVAERDANRNVKWDLYTISVTGDNEQLVAENASWGTWIGDNEILLSRKTKVFRKNLETQEETLLVDSEIEAPLGGADLQQPQLSTDGKFLAITLRGSERATGVFDLEKRTWFATGQGCQINWHPKGGQIYWVNPSGNGGSEVFSIPMTGGTPQKEFDYEQMQFIDIPGRRSHEYFPKMSKEAEWLVWAATQRGHDHDIADYEIYIWEIGAPADQATRLSFHSGNDRWPDIFVNRGEQPQ